MRSTECPSFSISSTSSTFLRLYARCSFLPSTSEREIRPDIEKAKSAPLKERTRASRSDETRSTTRTYCGDCCRNNVLVVRLGDSHVTRCSTDFARGALSGLMSRPDVSSLLCSTLSLCSLPAYQDRFRTVQVVTRNAAIAHRSRSFNSPSGRTRR